MTKTVLKLSVNIDGKQQQQPASENYVQITVGSHVDITKMTKYKKNLIFIKFNLY
jgi:hypothetical protein